MEDEEDLGAFLSKVFEQDATCLTLVYLTDVLLPRRQARRSAGAEDATLLRSVQRPFLSVSQLLSLTPVLRSVDNSVR